MDRRVVDSQQAELGLGLAIEDRLKILSSGFQMHVSKPVDPVELVSAIASVSHSLPNA
jgi:CheY-like chemotaxis protein